jgi:hypothetical protein
MYIDDTTTIEVISNLTNVQRHIMRTMLATGEDFDQLQPALQLVIGAQSELTIALDASQRADEEFEALVSKVRVETEAKGSEFCDACADQESIAAPGQTIYCRKHRG